MRDPGVVESVERLASCRSGGRRRRRSAHLMVLITAVGVVLALSAGACSSDGSGTSAGGGSTPPQTGSVADSGGADWPVYGHDASNTRTNVSESAITAASVTTLTKRWSKDGLVGVTGTPTVSNGVAYFGDWQGTVWAVRADSGEVVWKSAIGGTIVGAPAITDDAVYASSDHTLFRLDRATGTKAWQAVTDDHPQAQINASPVVIGDLVIQGTASFENILKKDQYTFRGSIAAYNTTTGTRKWKFFTTPGDATAGPGAGIWSTPAVDEARGLIFVGTGQSLQEPTAPLTDSLLAIDYQTGELKWSKQFTYPDVFSAAHPQGKDADIGASPNLWTSDGRDLVGAGDKGGTFHALDRDTGEVVWDTALTPGSFFGGEIGSAAFVDGKLVVSSNVGDPDTNAADGRDQGVRPGPGPRDGRMDLAALRREDLRSGGRCSRCRLRRHRQGHHDRVGHRDGREPVDVSGARQDRVRTVHRRRPGAVGVRVHPVRRAGGDGGVISFDARGVEPGTADHDRG